MLEEYDIIDTTTKTEDGFVQLVIMDAGLTEDPEERYRHLISKLRTYVAYSGSDQFQEAHPGISSARVRIHVMCRIPPTKRMLDTVSIARADDPDSQIPITYQHFSGTDDDSPTEEASSEPTPKKAARSIVFYIMVGLALMTILAALIGWVNAGRSPVPGILVGMFFAGLGFLFGRKR